MNRLFWFSSNTMRHIHTPLFRWENGETERLKVTWPANQRLRGWNPSELLQVLRDDEGPKRHDGDGRSFQREDKGQKRLECRGSPQQPGRKWLSVAGAEIMEWGLQVRLGGKWVTHAGTPVDPESMSSYPKLKWGITEGAKQPGTAVRPVLIPLAMGTMRWDEAPRSDTKDQEASAETSKEGTAAT